MVPAVPRLDKTGIGGGFDEIFTIYIPKEFQRCGDGPAQAPFNFGQDRLFRGYAGNDKKRYYSRNFQIYGD